MRDTFKGCVPIVVGFLLAFLFCLLITLCACRPTQKVIEVEKWAHDTTTVTDTVHVKEEVVIHDSIVKTEHITQWVQDSTRKDEAWKYYTYDKDGNVKSLLDYTSSTQHGRTSNVASQNATTSVGVQTVTNEETSGHTQAAGHSDALQSKEQVKTGLTRWQRFIMGLGYTFVVVLALGLMFGGMMLYGKWKRR